MTRLQTALLNYKPDKASTNYYLNFVPEDSQAEILRRKNWDKTVQFAEGVRDNETDRHYHVSSVHCYTPKGFLQRLVLDVSVKELLLL